MIDFFLFVLFFRDYDYISCVVNVFVEIPMQSKIYGKRICFIDFVIVSGKYNLNSPRDSQRWSKTSLADEKVK